ncbi:MAG: SPOR domain-containing protein [Gammaproteobacteria bacterium]|nr:SPOR domain-containing protein [Gammaproteobacteria bacterium]MDH4254180.1 SPOR domain-containing protein [Gammaproteobacteria bacterium]MDH5309974.1 SPOR domain-containing protein [Gammaproteobacteria bacterium]
MSRRRRKQGRTGHSEDYPGWVWMLFGLAIGLSVALAIYVKDRTRVVPSQPVAQTAGVPQSVREETTSQAGSSAEASQRRFDFYDMLPNFEVVIPEQEPDVTKDSAAAVVDEPGTYVLQAGSFSRYEDADRRRAELALQGIESRIQRVSIDDRTFHRVRIGPISDLDQLNRIRSRLRQANIDVLRIRLSD